MLSCIAKFAKKDLIAISSLINLHVMKIAKKYSASSTNDGPGVIKCTIMQLVTKKKPFTSLQDFYVCFQDKVIYDLLDFLCCLLSINVKSASRGLFTMSIIVRFHVSCLIQLATFSYKIASRYEYRCFANLAFQTFFCAYFDKHVLKIAYIVLGSWKFFKYKYNFINSERLQVHFELVAHENLVWVKKMQIFLCIVCNVG